MTENESAVMQKQRVEVEPPGMYKVVFKNDDVTPMEFVIRVLMDIFCLDFAKAHILTLMIHETGSGVAGTYTKDIAFTKVKETEDVAKNFGFPLSVIAEKE